MNPISLEMIHAIQGSINYWWGFAAVGRMGVTIPWDEIPFWVTHLLDHLRDSVGIEFEMSTGQWSGDDQ